MLPLPFCAIFSIVAFCMMNYTSEGSRPHTWNDVFDEFNSPLLPLRNFRDKSYYLALNYKANWFDAVKFCKNIRMKLLSIRSQEENDQIRKYIEQAEKRYPFWTGGSRLIDVQKWLWFPYGEEIVGQDQSIEINDQHCLSLLPKTKELDWNKALCDVRLNFICERYDEEPVQENL